MMASDPRACQLEHDCPWPAVARVVIAHSSRGPAYITVMPVTLAAGGVSACADHAHAAIDGMLLHALGPARPPAVEQLHDREGGRG